MNIKCNQFEAWLTRFGLFFAVMIIFWSPFSGSTRPPTLLLAILGLVYLVVYKTQLFKALAVRRWTWLFLLLWIPLWTSGINSYDVKATLSAIAWFPLLYLAGIALVQALTHTQSRIWLAQAMVTIVGIWFVDSTVQYCLGRDLIGVPMSIDGRVTGLFTDLHQGLIVLAVLPIAYYCLLDSQKPIATYLLLIAAGLMMALAGARNYVYVLVLIIFGIIFYQKLNPKRVIALLGVPVLVTLIAFGLSRQLIQMKIEHTEKIQQASTTTYQKINNALSYRLNIWETGYQMFLSSPVTGIGSKNFKRAYPEFTSRPEDPFAKTGIHAHNIYVELLAETGLVGFAGLLAVMTLCFRWYQQSPDKNKKMAWPFALSLMAIFFPINTTAPIMVPWWFPVLLLLVCGFIASLEDKA